MNTFQTCENVSDAIPLYLPQQLYLKPIARLKISIQLPQRMLGKSISNWEVMETLRNMIKPDTFSMLKVIKTNLDIIRLEAEADDKKKLEKVINKLDNKMMKLRDLPELLRIRTCEAKLDFPTRHMWDAFFREAKNMNEMKPGERPDTIHISNLPIKWFVPYHLSGDDDIKPSEKIFYRIFEKFGHIRRVDIPICDAYRSKMKAEVSGMQIFDFDEEHFFEGYVQFKDYVGFTKAMDAFRGMKLLHKADGECYAVNINVDFDKTKHLSDASVRRREIVRDRLVKKEIDKEDKERQEKEEQERKIAAERQKEIDQRNEKEKRRREREEKRKARILAKLKVKGADEINEKIAKEEKKLLKVQRKLEAIRLVEELFRRIKAKHEKDLRANCNKPDNEDELTRFKNSSELEVRQQTERLNRVIEGRVVLKSILSGGPHVRSYYNTSSSDSSDGENTKKKAKKSIPSEPIISEQYVHPADAILNSGDWYGYPPSNGLYQPYHAYPPPATYFPYQPRGRGAAVAGPSRGLPNPYLRRGRGSRIRGSFRGKSSLYSPQLHEQYYRYFERFLHEHDDRSLRNYSRSRSNSRSRSSAKSRPRHRSRRSYSRRRSRSRSYSAHRSRSYSRERSRTRKPRSRSRRSKSQTRGKKRPPSHSKRSKSKSDHSLSSSKSHHTPHSKHNRNSANRSRSNSVNRKTKEDDKSTSPSYRSIDSSKFISPSRLRNRRSKSWSFPRENNSANKARSWSKSVSPEKKN